MKSIKFIFIIILLALVSEIFSRKIKKVTPAATAAAGAGATAAADILPDEPCGYKYVFNRAVRRCVKNSGRRRRTGDKDAKKPVEAKPVEAKPVEAKPVNTKPQQKDQNVKKTAKKGKKVKKVKGKVRTNRKVDWAQPLIDHDNAIIKRSKTETNNFFGVVNASPSVYKDFGVSKPINGQPHLA